MATLSSEQIIALLQASGGDLSSLTGKGVKGKVSKRALLAALIKSPETLSALQGSAQKQYGEFTKFNPDYAYNPTEAINAVEQKYWAMSPKYGKFATKFWSDVRNAGTTGSSLSSVIKKFDDNREVNLAQNDLTDAEWTDLQDMFTKDLTRFQSAEAAKQKAQYKEFTSQRKKLGLNVEGEGGNAADLAVFKATGLRGLATMPTTLDQFVKRKAFRFKKALEQSGQTPLAQALLPQFEEQLKKKVGKNYQQFAIGDVIKRTMKGK